MEIHHVEVTGTDVDEQTRCAHYYSALDRIAIRFKCCGRWFPCYECHAEHTAHDAQAWSIGEHDALAVLCGACGHQLSIGEYLECQSICPKCQSAFNPGCANHYHLYFEQ